MWLLFILYLDCNAWIVPQPQSNAWITLAKVLNQDHMCLSMASVNNLMSTCLVGIPFQPFEFPLKTKSQVANPLALWCGCIKSLPQLGKEPLELELLH